MHMRFHVRRVRTTHMRCVHKTLSARFSAGLARVQKNGGASHLLKLHRVPPPTAKPECCRAEPMRARGRRTLFSGRLFARCSSSRPALGRALRARTLDPTPRNLNRCGCEWWRAHSTHRSDHRREERKGRTACHALHLSLSAPTERATM